MESKKLMFNGELKVFFNKDAAEKFCIDHGLSFAVIKPLHS